MLNEAVVAAARASANVTSPGPLAMLQVTTSCTPRGSASSVTEPCSSAVAGSSMVCAAPASTTGAWLRGMTVTATVSLLVSWPSEAVSFRTYSPATEKVADVAALAPLPNVTAPGPLTFVQAPARVPPAGGPGAGGAGAGGGGA